MSDERQPEYLLEVVCEHDGRADASPARLALIGYLPEPAEGVRIGYREWRECLEPGERRPKVFKTFYDVYRSRLADLPESLTVEQRALAARRIEAELEAAGMGAARWDFECPVCGDTERVRESRIIPKLSALRDNAVSRLTVRGLRVILKT